MVNKLNIRILFKMAIVCATLFAGGAHAKYDASISCDGTPRWDRFIVNDTDVKWVRGKDGECYPEDQVAAANERYDRLYGAYDENSVDYKKLYGDPNDINKSRALYGTYEKEVAPKPVKKETPKKAAAPVKKATPKPAPVPEKPVQKKEVKPAPVVVAKTPDVVTPPAPPKPKPAVVPAKPAPAPAATKIAKATAWSVDDFCTEINPPVKGKMPPGIVLMPGAPSQMSCVIR